MTTRDQARRVPDLRTSAATRAGVASEPTTSLPERLLAARESKGVDLYRAERDTKIRARYLGALERGDYGDLPGRVYTKGFLRNYALYLGLDPEDVINQWKTERGSASPAQPAIVIPRPLVAPRQGLTFSPGILVAALITVFVAIILGYFAMQLMRFNKPPSLAVTAPAVAVSEVDEGTTEYVLRGTSIAGATIEISGPGRQQPYRVTAGPAGTWSASVQLVRGRNQFDITARDPDTKKEAEQPARIVITVPLSVVLAPTLTLDQPAEGATFENGAIPVSGTATNATSVVVTASYVSSAEGDPAPSPSVLPAAPEPQAATLEDGAYTAGVELTAGRWLITATAKGAEGKTTSLSRTVVVQYKGVNLVVNVKGGRAWLKVWVDDKLVDSIGSSGAIFDNGKTLTFTGRESVKVWTGSAGTTYFTLNGRSLGRLGKAGVPEIWLFAPPEPPQKLQKP